MTLAPGTTLGRYQILEPLGSGGMATVYKAYEPSLDRTVALKVIRPGLSAEPDFIARFRREAQAVARLAHPTIVQVHAFDESDGQLYLVMQYLEGGTLKDRLAALAPGERLAWPEVARIVADVADALGYAHEQGIVHRDVKPSNVMLTAKGRAVVTDFGIARILGSAGMTQTGVGIGTPEYMAPEQGAGVHVDQRADIYALGVVAYELLCGRVPFIADTPFAVVAAHMRDALPLPRTLAPELPEPAERALLKALAKDPAQRFASAPEFAAALSDALAGRAALAGALAGRATVPTIAPRARRLRLSALPHPSIRTVLLAVVAMMVPFALIGRFGGPPAPTYGPLVAEVPAETNSATAARATISSGPAASPTPAPPHAIPAKGALFYQAKLDGTSSDVSGPTYDPGTAANTEFRYVPGAIELVAKTANAGGSFDLNMPARSNYVGELDIAATTATARPGSLWFQWSLRGCSGGNGLLLLFVDLSGESIELVDYLGQNRGRDHLTPLIPVPSPQAGAAHTIAVVVTGTNATVYVDEKQVADVPYTRCANSVRANLSFGSDRQSDAAGVIRITGARFYTVPG